MDSSDREKHHYCVFQGLSLFANTVAWILNCKVMKVMWGYEREKGEEKALPPHVSDCGKKKTDLFSFLVASLQACDLVHCLTLPETAGCYRKHWWASYEHSPSWYVCTFHSMFSEIRFKNELRKEREVFQFLADRHFPQQSSFYIPMPVHQLVCKVHITRNSSYSLMQCLS